MRDLGIGDVLDGYEITGLVARGGMATIFKAVERSSGRTVALKIPHIQYEADVVFYERFRREEEAARRLAHPNVVGALEPAGEKSRMYMVMEYVEGTPLSAILRHGKPLGTAQALDIARQVCDALAYLHGCGIVHRDVKPDNVLLTPHGQVKLIDFGIAHVAAARRLTISRLSPSLGTPDYMAPEQMRGRDGDERVDIYALGTMMYQMLAGQLPYSGADWKELLRSKRLDEPTPPSAYAPGLDPSLCAIVTRAIAPDPADRHATAVDLLEELRDPAAVRPRSPANAKARPRWRRLDPRPVAAALLILAALGGIGGIAWLAHKRGVEDAAGAAASSALRGAPRGRP